jgi:SPP1 family predicted phage head-tail adaptor
MRGAGKYDQRVVFKRDTAASQNTYGEDVLTTETLGTFWAHVQYGSGREFHTAHQRWAETTVAFEIRRQPGVTIVAKDYAEWNSKTWDILGVLNIGTRQDCWLIAAKDIE